MFAKLSDHEEYLAKQIVEIASHKFSCSFDKGWNKKINSLKFCASLCFSALVVRKKTKMKNIELNITALSASSTSSGNFVMVLQEIDSPRKLPIIIGIQEAQAIAVALEQMHPVRPLTHDLFLNTIGSLKASLECVKICGIKDGTYISVIVIKDSNKNLIEIDSRTSDAIALAIRQNCPILINENLLAEMAISEPAEGKIFSDKRGQLEQYSLEELYGILANLLAKEDYESATILRDIISKKEQQ